MSERKVTEIDGELRRGPNGAYLVERGSRRAVFLSDLLPDGASEGEMRFIVEVDKQ